MVRATDTERASDGEVATVLELLVIFYKGGEGVTGNAVTPFCVIAAT